MRARPKKTATLLCFAMLICTAGCNGESNSNVTDPNERVQPASKVTDSKESGQEEKHPGYVLGKARDDLDQFYGLYALPDQPDRRLFVAKAVSPNPDRPIPDGYIMIGAMWGDAANWYMKSLGKLRFEQQWVNPGGTPLVAEFKTDATGHAVSMSVTSDYFNYEHMPRVGDLPEGW